MVTKLDLQKTWFGYDEQTQEYAIPVDEDIRFFSMPEGATIGTAGSYATSDIWTLEFEGKVYIASKGDYNNNEGEVN